MLVALAGWLAVPLTPLTYILLILLGGWKEESKNELNDGAEAEKKVVVKDIMTPMKKVLHITDLTCPNTELHSIIKKRGLTETWLMVRSAKNPQFTTSAQ